MKLNYYAATDSLYIDLSEQPSVESREISEGIVLDYDSKGTLSPAPPLTREILGPVEAVSARSWPGVPVVPTMAAGATDGRFTINAGIPTYGISGIFHDPDGTGVHGLNERIRVRSVYEGYEFLYRLVRLYAGGK